jgi:hypothetical protein
MVTHWEKEDHGHREEERAIPYLGEVYPSLEKESMALCSLPR